MHNTPHYTPSPKKILARADSSDWLKDALRSALTRDPVDALADAQTLTAILQRRVDECIRRHGNYSLYGA